MDLKRVAAMAFGALLWLMAQQALAAQPSRVALVIGNQAYPGVDALMAPENDAAMMETRLRELDFSVTRVGNRSHQALRRDLADFARSAEGAEVALLYYAGHGFEIEGENYLIPLDIGTPIDTVGRDEVRLRGIALGPAIWELEAAGPKAVIAIIDACRSLPTRGDRSQQLVPISSGEGTLVAFSTAPGARAIDSLSHLGRDPRAVSPFALFLHENLGEPGLTLTQVLEATTLQVRDTTAGAQVPWFTSGMVGPVVLNANTTGTRAGRAQPASRPRGPMGHLCPDDRRREASRLWNGEMSRVELELTRLDAQRFATLLQRARKGDRRGMAAVGLAYERGLGTAVDLEKAAYWWRRSAEDDYVIGMTLLGEAYGEGIGVERDWDEAERWMRRASNAGFARASINLMTLEGSMGGQQQMLMLGLCQFAEGFDE